MRVEFDVKLFSIFLSYYLRVNRLTIEEFAKKVGTDSLTLKKVLEGKLEPSERVLDAMGATSKRWISWDTSRKIEVIDWMPKGKR